MWQNQRTMTYSMNLNAVCALLHAKILSISSVLNNGEKTRNTSIKVCNKNEFLNMSC